MACFLSYLFAVVIDYLLQAIRSAADFFLSKILSKKIFRLRAQAISKKENASSNPRPPHRFMRILIAVHSRERVHFEAPPSSRIGKEMDRFLDWFEHSRGKI